MAQNDIYKSKEKYESYLGRLDDLTDPKNSKKYYIKNSVNIQYFWVMHKSFEARDISYVRRLRLFNVLKFISHHTTKDFKELDRDDINNIVANMYKVNKSMKTQTDFIQDIKNLWRHLFPEKDEKGRVDDTITPYNVRHLKPSQDRSKKKARQDKLTLEEVKSIINYFEKDERIQAFLSLIYYDLGRPQEILYTQIRHWEDLESCGKLHIESHGKEGTKFLQCFDSYPFIVSWLNEHPFKDNPEAYLFPTYYNKKNKQLTPNLINIKLRKACEEIGIKKRVTCYSFKRNGITHLRLSDVADIDIQHKAGWTSTKQLKTYDMSGQEDAFKKEMVKRGLSNTENSSLSIPQAKTCTFCGQVNKPTLKSCTKCKRLLDRTALEEEIKKAAELRTLMQEMDQFKDLLQLLKRFKECY